MSGLSKYRPEIDGLRTLAVLAVIIFHFNPASLIGGFLGVDVFFVISGFLITGIIYGQFEKKSFSFVAFWKRRFKRLYPALLFMVLGSLWIGYFILPQPERGQLPWQALASMLSYSNFLLWKTTGGYWDSASESISLLHTWSLSLEEQFYIVFPILIWLGFKWFPGKIKFVILALLIASFVGCIILTKQDRNASFYLLPTRMWELLIGGVLAINQRSVATWLNTKCNKSWLINLVHVGGVSAILVSYFIVKNDDLFPGYTALPTCFGAFLLILPFEKRSLVTSLLSWKPVVYIGKISYSLYLWHWPLIVYGNYSGQSMIQVAGAILVMSLISYHFIETPFRHALRIRPAILGAGAMVFISSVILVYYTPKSPLLSKFGNFEDPITLTKGISYNNIKMLGAKDWSMEEIMTNKPVIMIVGSSHAMHFCEPIEKYANSKGYDFISLAASGIHLTGKIKTYRGTDASVVNSNQIKAINTLQPNILIIASRWGVETRDDQKMKEVLQALSHKAKSVVVIGQVPHLEFPNEYNGDVRKYITSRVLTGKPLEFSLVSQVAIANDRVEKALSLIDHPNKIFLNPYHLMLTDQQTPKLVVDGKFLYCDDDHINSLGAEYIFDNLLKRELDRLVQSFEK